MVEPIGIDLSEFRNAPSSGDFRCKIPALKEALIVLFLGRLHHKKGVNLLIEAFVSVTNESARLVLAGPASPDYLAYLRNLVTKSHLDGRVVFTGMLYGAERIAALADADLFVLPSHQENFGLAVVESLAAGTPVIISDQVNIHREIAQAGCGEAIPLDSGRLAAAITRWLDNAALRREASRRASAFARDTFDWAQLALRWVGIYSSVSEAHSTGACGRSS
ncbi:MAG: glycosyltransferase [Candidatus Competibacteraceae bacterium]|nr:glycosyltransferase [Candidatus Competibacteraceae bacterium]